MNKNKNKNKKMVRKSEAYKTAEAVVMESEQLTAELMQVLGQHAMGEHPTLVALMGLASTVAEILKMQEMVGIEDAKERFLYLLASELTLRGLMADVRSKR